MDNAVGISPRLLASENKECLGYYLSMPIYLRDPTFSRFGTIPAFDGRTHDNSIYRARIASRGKIITNIPHLQYICSNTSITAYKYTNIHWHISHARIPSLCRRFRLSPEGYLWYSNIYLSKIKTKF